jgi:hypothetical protein
MTGPGVFDVALTSDDERRIAKTAAQDKLAAAIYDVRQLHGDWLFGATDISGFRDRVAMCRTSICHTIEPHVHAGIGVQNRVIKAMEREWRQRQACYPGCDENEAHAAKFHKDKSDDSGEKEARRRQAYEYYGDENPNVPIVSSNPGTPAQEAHIPGSLGFKPSGEAVQFHNGARYAEFEDQPDHPELHTKETYQDHEGEELIPEGNFEGYKDRVDQGTPEKVDNHAFIPGAHDQQHTDSGDHNFVNKVTGSREFQTLYAMLRQADDTTGNDPNAGVSGTGAAPGAAAPPAPNMTTSTSPAGAAGAASPATPAMPAPPMNTGMPMTASTEYREMVAMLANEKAVNWARTAVAQGGSLSARVRLLEAARGRGIDAIVDAFVPVYSNRRKCADRNYLQQADEALTKVLNEKAEEFQNTIAPLQQALITIQQAEQLSNPLAVQPPAGTVNVLPQGAAGAGGQAPQGAGGLGADPAAAMLAGQQPAGGQQMAASLHQAADPLAPGLRVWHDNHGGNKPTGTTTKTWVDPEQGTMHGVHWDDGTEGEHPSHELNTHGERVGSRRPFDWSRVGNVNDDGGPYEPRAPHGSPEDMANRGYIETYQGRPVPKGRSIHEPGVIDEIMKQPAPQVPRRANVTDEYQNWLKKKPGLPTGGQVDVDNFVQQKHVGPRAQQTLTQAQGLPTEPKVARRRRRAISEPGYVWSKSPESTKGEFASRVASGETPDGAYRKMIAEIADHHSKGIIGSHDAHRAANEAFGRLLLSRRGGQGKQSRPFV